jgi:hypothetical protein
LPERLRGLFEAASLPVPLLGVMAVAAIGVTLYPFLLRWSGRSDSEEPRAVGRPQRPLTARLSATRTALVAALMVYALPSMRVSGPRALLFPDRHYDPIFATAAAAKGLLLTGNGLHLIQLRTRRPVLLDGGALDILPYALDAAPAMHRILQDVYGIDLLDPPDADVGAGVIPAGINRAVWEGYSRDRWREIRRTYHVTQVLTDQGWRLDLPLIVQSRRLRLYEIPE